MTNVMNDNPIMADIEDRKDVFKHGAAKLNAGKASKSYAVLKQLNSTAANLAYRELRARDVTYSLVAGLVDAATEFSKKGEAMKAFMALFDVLFGQKATDQGDNPYLPLVRAADGEWVEVVVKKKSVEKKWKWTGNRSSEKYAGVCRFCVKHAITGKDLLAKLGGNEPFLVEIQGKTVEVGATINALIAADRDEQPTKERDVLSNDDWQNINRLKPVFSVPYTEQLKAAFTLSEGGTGCIAIIVRDGMLHAIGSDGRVGNPILRMFKEQENEFRTRQLAAASKPETVATLDPVLER